MVNLKTDDQEAIVQLKEVLELWEGEKKLKEVHDAVISTFRVRFVQLPGHKDYSPIGEYAGLRERMADERLEHIRIVISVGTTIEAKHLQEILMSREDVIGDDLIDVQRIITGTATALTAALSCQTY